MKSVNANKLTCSDAIMATNIGTIIIRTAWGYLGAGKGISFPDYHHLSR